MEWKIAPIHNEKNETTHYLAIQRAIIEWGVWYEPQPLKSGINIWMILGDQRNSRSNGGCNQFIYEEELWICL